jgi:rhodanese-related sulfurtransferase/glutaredoxin
MKNAWLIVLLFVVTSCKSQSGTDSKLSAEEFEKVINLPGAQILDVRTGAEFNSGHIKNAMQANWVNREEFTERVKFIDKDKPVYLYCLVGSRSSAAANWLLDNGFKNVAELQGGINAWKRANKTVEGISNLPQISMEAYQAIISTDKTILIDFSADWCPPCVKMKPILEELEKSKNLNFQLIKIDAGVNTEIMKSLNIEPIPFFIIYKNGKEVWRKQGVISKEELHKQLQS